MKRFCAKFLAVAGAALLGLTGGCGKSNDSGSQTGSGSGSTAAGENLIVVGAQGHGSFTDRVLGSVTYRLAHHADRPVVIVPRAA